ncbi:MAG: NADH-quinone oxidoreductase subunit L [Oligoflexia bacterium]|nr:NADH-quinone oxidoreductase subunit L [Oligoflexia bacterium]MBF0366265.1 NADH-quinone oxidoreductase subunit L [Oligoflexia bacterium]
MSELFLILFFPLVGFLINGLWGSRLQEKSCALIGCAFPLLSLFLLTYKTAVSDFYGVSILFTWVSFENLTIDFALKLDHLSLLMSFIVLGIGSLIHIYSTKYMHGDQSFARYFSYLNLFLFFMLLLVLANNLLVMFIGWEGVGLASYLLIGFWYKENENASSGAKAFIVNRIGDIGFLLGIFILAFHFQTINFDEINRAASTANASATMINLSALFLFIGACGKSAQLPLHVWLPDAMTGPTPVSALIHAATMVTAGIYMIVRLHPLYMQATAVLPLIAVIGTLTALLGALVATVQSDIKRVLAYSTVSQLGYMFAALGVGAFYPAMLHLFTHAFFKATLFLSAGAIIHALHGEQDIYKMGGLAKKMPWNMVAFLLGSLCLAGVPLTSGFISKEAILMHTYSHSHSYSQTLTILLLITAALTAFYISKTFFLVFLPSKNGSEKPLHAIAFAMSLPVIALAILSIVVGLFHIPAFMENYLNLAKSITIKEEAHILIPALSLSLSAFAIAIAYLITVKQIKIVPKILEQKFYFDHLYEKVLLSTLRAFCKRVLATIFEVKIIEAAIWSMRDLVLFSSRRVTLLTNGQIQWYVLLILMALSLLMVWWFYV